MILPLKRCPFSDLISYRNLSITNILRRVLIVNPWAGNIGPNTYLKNFHEKIPKNIRINFTVIYPYPDSLSKEMESLGYKVIYNKLLKLNHINNPLLKILWRIFSEFVLCLIFLKLSIKNRYDISLVNTEMYSFSLFFLAMISPIYVVVHSLSFGSASSFSRVVFSIQKRFVKKYLAVSNAVKEALKKVNVKNNVEVTYNGVNLPLNNLRQFSAPVRVISVIHPVPHKGAHLLIDVFKKLKESDIDFEWTILGWFNKSADKKYESEIVEKIKELDFGDKIKILGNVDNLHEWYSKSDFLVHPSLSESFGFVVAEGMSYSLPVIAFNVGALSEIINDGKTGFLISPFDTMLMAEKVKVLAKDINLRLDFGEASRKVIAKRFLVEDTMAHVYKVIGLT